MLKVININKYKIVILNKLNINNINMIISNKNVLEMKINIKMLYHQPHQLKLNLKNYL